MPARIPFDLAAVRPVLNLMRVRLSWVRRGRTRTRISASTSLGFNVVSFLAASILAAGPAAQASPILPAAQASGTISITNQNYYAAGSYSVTAGVNPRFPVDTFNISMGYLSGISGANASGTLAAINSQQSDVASVSFDFEVLAPTDTTALVDFEGSLSAQATGGADYAYADATLGSSPTLSALVCASSGGLEGPGYCNPSVSSSFSELLSFTVPTNTIESFDVQAGGGGQIGSFLATVDPSLTLDPADTSGGTLLYSADLVGSVLPNSPTTGVPEPATLFLFAAGLGACALLRFVSGPSRHAPGSPRIARRF